MSAAGGLEAGSVQDPVRMERLLFAPLRGAVVERSDWKPALPSVPAAALPELLAIVREGLGDQFAVWSSSSQGRAPGAAPPLGARLWPAAAKLLRAAPCPPLWSASTGLAFEHFDLIRTPVAQLLAQATLVETFVAQCDPSRPLPEPRHVRTLLDEIARGGAPGFRLALVVLLRRCPRLEQLAALALSTARGDDAIEEAAYSGATYVLDTVVSHQQKAAAAPVVAGTGQARALAVEVAEAARLTRCVEAMAALRPLSRLHREVGRKRVILQTVCLDRFEELVAALLLEPLAAGRAEDPVGFAALRKVAWGLGEACDALRLLGDRHGTERAIQRAQRRIVAALGERDPQGAIAAALVERLRGDGGGRAGGAGLIAGAAALGALAGLAVLVAEEPPASVSPGDVVASDHLTAGCATGEVAVAMNPAGLAGSGPALAKMVQAHCKAIAPDTRLLVIAPVEKGAMRVQPVSGIAEPVFVAASDFAVLPARR